MLHNERSHSSEKPAHMAATSSPRSQQLEKACSAMKAQHSQKEIKSLGEWVVVSVG